MTEIWLWKDGREASSSKYNEEHIGCTIICIISVKHEWIMDNIILRKKKKSGRWI